MACQLLGKMSLLTATFALPMLFASGHGLTLSDPPEAGDEHAFARALINPTYEGWSYRGGGASAGDMMAAVADVVDTESRDPDTPASRLLMPPKHLQARRPLGNVLTPIDTEHPTHRYRIRNVSANELEDWLGKDAMPFINVLHW